MKRPEFQDWLQNGGYRAGAPQAFCKICNLFLTAHVNDLRKHSKTKKHRNRVAQAAQGKDIEQQESGHSRKKNTSKMKDTKVNSSDHTPFTVAWALSSSMQLSEEPIKVTAILY
jgi:hypothetical protein